MSFETTIKNLYDTHDNRRAAFSATSKAETEALEAYKLSLEHGAKMKPFHELVPVMQERITGAVDGYLKNPDSIPAEAPYRNAILKIRETQELKEKAVAAHKQAKDKTEELFRIDKNDHVSLLHDDKLEVSHWNGKEYQDIEIPREHLTTEGLKQYRNHEILGKAPIWEHVAKAEKIAAASAKKVEHVSKRLEGVFRRRHALVKDTQAIWDRMPEGALKSISGDDFNRAWISSVSAKTLEEKVAALKALQGEHPQVAEMIPAFEKLAKINRLESKATERIAKHLPEGSNIKAHVNGLHTKVEKELHAAETASTATNVAHTAGQSASTAGNSVANVAKTAEGWAAKFSKLHWGKKTAIIGGAAAVVGGVGYWALKAKDEKDSSQHTTGAQR